MAVAYKIKEVSGNRVNAEISLKNKQYLCQCFNNTKVLFTSLDDIEVLTNVNVGIKDGIVLVKQSVEQPNPDKELVVVHEYQPGCGAKRWPGFWIDWEKAGEIQTLTQVVRQKGSGSDVWSLIIAPAGWAENIAGQFIDERDFGTQKIAYQPEGQEAEVDNNDDTPYALFVAFSGDKENIKSFMEKVEKIKTSKIDAHILLECGRGRIRSHLEEVSGDPDFFLGADPNKVASYVAMVHGI